MGHLMLFRYFGCQKVGNSRLQKLHQRNYAEPAVGIALYSY